MLKTWSSSAEAESIGFAVNESPGVKSKPNPLGQDALLSETIATMNIGIVRFGFYVPQGFGTAAEIARQSGLSQEEVAALGIGRKFLPAPEDQPVSMAVKAARQVFQKTRVATPADVDVVIWTGEEYKDYIAQTAAIRLQEEVGCRNAWAFDLVGQGVTSILGLRVARDLMRGDPTVNTVLLAGGTRNIDLIDPANPNTHFLLAASASGGAILLKRDYGENLLLDTRFIVDAEMADAVFVPGGGTAIPFRADNLRSESMFYQVPDPKMLAEYLKNRWCPALVEVIRRVSPERTPDYLALRHLSPEERQQVLDQLQMKPERSMSLNNWGHHGPNDILISLDHGLKSKAVGNGSLVVLASGGIGFTYAAALVQWGRR
jgi:3-oxoacyl-[acyl-carrier-protein] synthase III